MLGLIGDEMERGGIPEYRGTTVTEQNLISVGQREECVKPIADFGDFVAHGRLAVRRAHVGRPVGDECAQLLGADLRRTGSESSITGEKLGGNLDRLRRTHRLILTDIEWSVR